MAIVQIIVAFLIGISTGLAIGLWVDRALNRLLNRKIVDEPNKPIESVPAFMPEDVSAEYRRKKQDEFFKK